MLTLARVVSEQPTMPAVVNSQLTTAGMVKWFAPGSFNGADPFISPLWIFRNAAK